MPPPSFRRCSRNRASVPRAGRGRLSGLAQVLVYMAVAKLGEKPTDGPAPAPPLIVQPQSISSLAPPQRVAIMQE